MRENISERFLEFTGKIILLTLVILCLSAFTEGDKNWPHPLPCRIKNSMNPELFIMTLGDVKTKLSQGIFYPEKDLIILNDGSEITNYYKDTLEIKYFMPIDKTDFPLPPSGWCSWYYYYQEISADEIKKNAKWLAENLKEYGGIYCQIDDGWQGTGHGLGENRDWTTIDKRFPEGMKELATYIRELGLLPGIWLAPHGQSNREVVDKWNAFLLKEDRTTASDTWEGTYLVDPTASDADEYMKDLFNTMADKWGYDYFKIDGQPIVINEYKNKQSFMKNSDENPVELYRHTLNTIREAIGEKRYLLGCWGIPLDGIGIMNGSRTGGDVFLDWDEGFITAVNATMSYYYLHNIAWYCDPDVMCVRSPLTMDMARAWATLQGLTGQGLMDSDRLMDLSPERVEIMKRVYPAVDIRPLDLFPSKRNKKIWDLKINHLGRNYDIAGCFNYKKNKTDVVHLNWEELGLPANAKVHVFDFWNEEYLGCWEKGYFAHLAPASCQVLTLMVAEEYPQLISTNRHITQGWVDLIKCSFDEKTNTYSGESQVIGNDTYELRFVFPRPGKTYRIKSAVAENLKAVINNHQGWASIRFTSPESKKITWKVIFEPTEIYTYPVNKPYKINVEPLGFNGVKLSWFPNYYLTAGYNVYYNNVLLGMTPESNVILRNLNFLENDFIEIASVWYDGTESQKKTSVKIELDKFYPDEIFLSDIEPNSATAGWGGTPKNDEAIDNRPLIIGDKTYSKGIGTHAVSDIEYSLKGFYKKFTAEVGLDAYSLKCKQGTVVFQVFGDDKLLWESGVIKYSDPVLPINIDISGVDVLRLHVGDAGDGIDYDHANWGNAKIGK
ncbi:MAG: NPCBM/NEW2 domain-containing protein [Bacteroidetes bacterium]|nr:NPCBM/NEW2 domain-containing protein [Bacteroidota bacterium]